jgi:hypothetical protein
MLAMTVWSPFLPNSEAFNPNFWYIYHGRSFEKNLRHFNFTSSVRYYLVSSESVQLTFIFLHINERIT